MYDRDYATGEVQMSLVKLWQYSLGSYSDEKTKPYDKQMLIVRQYGFYYILLLVCLSLLVMVEYWVYGNV